MNWLFNYILQRVLQSLAVLMIVSFICFVIFCFSGDPVVRLSGPYATTIERAEIRAAYGLDKPFYHQYWNFIVGALHGDFGKSYVNRVDTLDLIFERFSASFELAATALFLSVSMGILLGVAVSVRPHAKISRVIMLCSLGGISIPTFLIGILLMMLFAVFLGILPPFGRGETVMLGSWSTGLLTLDGMKHMVLPAVTLAGYQLAVILRLTRAGMREILTEEFIKTAWAKGLSPFTVIFKHALRNVLIPIVTMCGLMFGELIAFAVITETIFQWPGMGNLLITSIYETDHPVIVTYIMMIAVIILIINVSVDIIYAFLNPTIRYE